MRDGRNRSGRPVLDGPSTSSRNRGRQRAGVALLAVGALLFVVGLAFATAGAAAEQAPRFTGDGAETERFLGYEASIQLTADQERVRVEALSAIAAPCCAKFNAATCCCKCNMARAAWGLAKHLIVERDFDAVQVRDAVASWHRAINPAGFSGDTCFTSGGCARPFVKNGCGGMKRDDLVY